MKNCIVSVLYSLLLISFCEAQSIPVTQNAHVKNISPNPPQHSFLVKTQGSNQYENIHDGLQDKHGNLWFGTTGEGIYTYDGKIFKQYYKDKGLHSNNVWCLLEDREGNIWAGTDDGICKFNGKSFERKYVSMPFESSMKFDGISKNPNFRKYDVWSIMQDSKGTIWFATTFGVYCFDGNSFSRFLDNDSASVRLGFQSNRVEYILEDRTGNFWFGGRGNNGVFRYDGKTMTKLNIKQEEWSWPLLEDSKGNIWFSNWASVYYYNTNQTKNGFTKLEGYTIQNTTRIIEDNHGDIWLGSDSKIGGIHRYDGKSIVHYNVEDGLTNNSIWMILQEKAGSLWIGTRNNGLYKFDGKYFIPFSK